MRSLAFVLFVSIIVGWGGLRQRCACLFQPLEVRSLKVGREGAEYLGMVVVEPLELLWGEELDHDGCLVDGEECYGFEAEECSKVGLFGFHANGKVFYADTVAALYVDAWLVGRYHACFYGNVDRFLANVLWSFVHVEAVANAMACSVSVVYAIAPHALSGKGVELRASGAFGENGARQTNGSFEG